MKFNAFPNLGIPISCRLNNFNLHSKLSKQQLINVAPEKTFPWKITNLLAC